MRKRIRVITPVVTEGIAHVEEYQKVAGAGTEMSLVFLRRGPASCESEMDHALAVPDIVAIAIEAEREGIDALIVNSVADPGLIAAREVVSIPVLGPSQVSMHMAAMLGHRFSVVTVLDDAAPVEGEAAVRGYKDNRSALMFETEALVYGLKDKLASTRWIEIPVSELVEDPQKLLLALIDKAAEAITHDGAHAIVFGCTGLFGFAEAVQQGLVERGYPRVPVLDPISVAIKLAEALIDLKLSHSKRTYPAPVEKRILGYDIPAWKKG